MSSRLAYIISAFIFAALIWASFAQIRELAVAHGEVIPAGAVTEIQHLEGGEIQTVHVDEGTAVEKGQPLVTLRPVSAESDLGQLNARAAGLRFQQEVLAAMLADRQPDFGALGERYPDLAAEHRNVHSSRHRHQSRELAALRARVAQRQAEIEALAQEVASLERQVEIRTEQYNIRKRLLRSGYTSRRAFLEAETAVEQVRSTAYATKGRLRSAEEQLVEARNQLEAAEADTTRTLSEERSKLSAELAELDQQIAKHRDRVDRLVVRAPERGVIQELAHRARGEVIKPGDLVAKLVPLDRVMVAEVRVEPKDIGHVKSGDPAEIKVTTFDAAVFGVVKGVVSHLSATTFTSDEGETYYKAIVSLDRGHVGQGGNTRPILPGMVVQADIITGAKSLMRYLLKPVYRSLDTGFSER